MRTLSGQDRYLLDKAIDLLDETGARVQLRSRVRVEKKKSTIERFNLSLKHQVSFAQKSRSLVCLEGPQSSQWSQVVGFVNLGEQFSLSNCWYYFVK